jgi:hypothetical protein
MARVELLDFSDPIFLTIQRRSGGARYEGGGEYDGKMGAEKGAISRARSLVGRF